MFKHLVKSQVSKEAFTPSAGRSDLFNELSELCQSVFDNLPDDINTQSHSDAIDSAYDAMKAAEFAKRLCAIVNKHLNLKIKTVEIMKGTYLNAAMGFGLDIPKGNNPAQIFVSNVPQYSIVNILQYVSQLSTTQKDDGSIDPSDAMEKIMIVNFYFIPTWWCVPNLWPGYSVSADSIAAVILHEIGHALNFYRDFGRIRKYNDVVTDVIPHVTKARTRKDYEEILDVIEKITVDLEERVRNAAKEGLSKSDLAGVQFTIKAQRYLVEQQHKNLKNAKDEDIEKSKEFGAFMYFATMLVVDYATNINGWFSMPSTELMRTDTQMTYEERLADEFAARNGAGSALSAGLTLMFTLGEKYDSAPISKLRMMPVIGSFIDFMKYLNTVTDISATIVSSTYDPPIERLRQIVKTSMGAIKDKSLDAKARDYYVQQIKEAQAFLDEYANSDTSKAREKFASLATAVFSVPFIPLLLLLKRMGGQYHGLQDWTDNLIRNELAFQSARIDKLTR